VASLKIKLKVLYPVHLAPPEDIYPYHNLKPFLNDYASTLDMSTKNLQIYS
jgi:hypothetical protein